MTRRNRGRHRMKGAAASPRRKTSLLSTQVANSSPSSTHGAPTGHPTGKSIAACLVYAAASLAIVFLNRFILKKRFPFPITLAWFQEFVGATIYAVLSYIGEAARHAHLADAESEQEKLYVSTENSSRRCCLSHLRYFGDLRRSCKRRSGRLFIFSRHWVAHCLCPCFPVVPLRAGALRRLLPVSIAFVGMIGFGNACLQRVQVSTYQVARSLTLVMTLGLQRFLLGHRVSWKAAVCCCVICFGFFFGSLETATLSLSGALTGSLASLSQAMYTTLVRRAVDHIDSAEAAAMYYNMVNATLLLPPLLWASGEAKSLSAYLFGCEQDWKDELVQGTPVDVLQTSALIGGQNILEVAALLLASGMLAFLLTISTSWIISLTSPLTFGVLGYAKACAQTILGFWILQEKCTFRALAGVVLTISGSLMFFICKRQDANVACSRRRTLPIVKLS